MTSATFNWSVWSARYAELVAGGVKEPLATSLFDEAGLYLNNGPCSVVQDIPTRTILLNMITAHLAALHLQSAASASNGGVGAVGRVASVTQGSVSMSLDYGTIAQGEAFWAQTPYGSAWWAATAQYRTARYLPNMGRFLGTARGPLIW